MEQSGMRLAEPVVKNAAGAEDVAHGNARARRAAPHNMKAAWFQGGCGSFRKAQGSVHTCGPRMLENGSACHPSFADRVNGLIPFKVQKKRDTYAEVVGNGRRGSSGGGVAQRRR